MYIKDKEEKKGMKLYSEGKVLMCTQTGDTQFEGFVAGDEGESYFARFDMEHPEKTECSCSSRERPCEHVAALYYSLHPDKIIEEEENDDKIISSEGYIWDDEDDDIVWQEAEVISPARNTQTKGMCRFCHKDYAKRGIVRHLASCKERKKLEESINTRKKAGYFELMITAPGIGMYWLAIEIKDDVTLGQLDAFLRDIWLECCGHLSSFFIGGMEYCISEEDIWDDVTNMEYMLRDLLDEGMEFSYIYDFGSSTELNIKVTNHRTGKYREEEIKIMARNNPAVYICQRCGKPAEFLTFDMENWMEAYWCGECLEKAFNEYELDDSVMVYQICNSPRMGVCGYEGGIIDLEWDYAPFSSEERRCKHK